MKFKCIRKCYFNEKIYKKGDIVEGDKFEYCHHFKAIGRPKKSNLPSKKKRERFETPIEI